MTQSLKQTVELVITEIKINYSNDKVSINVVGSTKLKEENLLVKFFWTTDLGASTLTITNDVCIDKYFKNALQTVLSGYTNGILHSTKIGFTFNTSENGQLER
jgi:hypothetical protein